MKWRYRVQKVGNPTEVIVRHKPYSNEEAGAKALSVLRERGVMVRDREMVRVEAGNRVTTFFKVAGQGLLPVTWGGQT